MSFDPAQLAALVAVVEEGTFEAAADRLRVTPSAVSQRMKALERAVGQVVVGRVKPCHPTATGEVLLRHARQLSLLDAETRAALAGPGEGWTELPVVVNADSLATWFAEVVARVAAWDDVGLRLQVEDQQHSARQLRAGAVMAAVTADPTPVQGCTVTPLGGMRYVPVARREWAQRWRRPGGGYDLARMPMVCFNELDDEQHALLRELKVTPRGRVTFVPSSADFAAAVRAGVGWGALPTDQLGPDLEAAGLVRVAPRDRVVALYWQRWRLDSTRLARVSAVVASVAASRLTATH